MRQLDRNFATSINHTGSSQSISIAAQSFTGALTMGVWFKRQTGAAVANAQTAFFFHSTGSQKIFLREPGAGNNLFFRVVNAGSSANWNPGYTNSMDGNWNFLVVVRDGTGLISASLNGAVLNSSGSTITGTFITDRIMDSAGTSQFKLDELFMIDGTALSNAEIAKLYIDGVIPYATRMWYKFDEGSGTTANDSSGNGITGTITGATYSTDVFMTAPRTVTGTRTVIGSSRTIVGTRTVVT